jgi:Domain of unknown function (DUF397)
MTVAEMNWAELTWLKSSGSAEQNCVDVAFISEMVLVRDSKDPDGPFLKLPAGQWDAFVKRIKGGDFTS